MDITNWLLFSSIALLAALSPGPAILLVSSHSFAYGVRRSVATMLGNISGLFIMSSLSVAGLSAIILHSTAAYTLVKLFGTAYLIYLGVKLIRNGFGSSSAVAKVDERANSPSLKKLYAHGILVALSNPKAIAFTTALFPQFVDQSMPILPQFVILVATIMSLSFTCLLVYAYLSARASKKVSDTGRFANVLSKLFGLIFIISGILLAGVTQRQT